MYRLLTGSLLATLILIVVPLTNWWYWTKLPPQVATHFNATGQPDDWMTKSAAVAMMASLQIGLPLFVLAIVALIDKLPNSAINIPNREYWLGEEQRDRTLRFLFDSFLLLAIVLVLLLLVLNHLTFQANMDGAGLNMAWFLSWMGAFTVFIGGFVAVLLIRFGKPADETVDSDD